MRALSISRVLKQQTRDNLVAFLTDISSGIDTDHLHYMITRGISIWDIIPQDLRTIARMSFHVRLPTLHMLEENAIVEAALEARPDAASILRTPKGVEWLRLNLFDGR
jgi:hypothetical protein